MNQELKQYLRDLNIIKNNLTKFYYFSSIEWLKPAILDCITSVRNELNMYHELMSKYAKRNDEKQVTIYDLGVSK